MATDYVSVRIPSETLAEIDREAARTDRNRSKTIIALLERGLARPPDYEEKADLPGHYQQTHAINHHIGRVDAHRGAARTLREENEIMRGLLTRARDFVDGDEMDAIDLQVEIDTLLGENN